ncbi:ion channel [Alkaliphilus crotonatoxidans]
MRRRTVIFYNIIILFVISIIIASFFAVIYIVLEILEVGVIVDHYSSVAHQEEFRDIVTRSIYFSFITLFAVGYGDMTPFGLSKGVAIIQAFIGYIFQYIMIINYLIINPRILRYVQKKLKA